MQRIWYIPSLCLTLILLSGCSSRTHQPISFDHFSMQRYTNDKIYVPDIPTGDNSIIYQSKHQTTWVANSLLVTKMTLVSWAILGDITQSNYEQLQKKLVNYKGDKPNLHKTTCGKADLTWYILSFSYDMTKDQHFWAYQYFFTEAQYLYIISFHTSDSKDINRMAKSIKGLTCN